MDMETLHIWTVTRLNEEIKALLEARFDYLWIEGEVSNLRRPPSGHVYFTLKDDRSQIRAVIFQQASRRGRPFELEDGMAVLLMARLTLYHPRGEYQLIVERVEPRGLGALQKAFEQLKEKLRREGLFDAARKRPLPYLPRTVGVVTSPSGAVLRDIMNVSRRRFPTVRLVLAPVRVQGLEAPAEIVRAIADLNALGGVDVLVLARGGGSWEDLYPFNTEEVARAVAASAVPVVSAVGHETDFTIADFVADLRAPTPSAAMEIILPHREELRVSLSDLHWRLANGIRRAVGTRQETVLQLRRRLRDPGRLVAALRLNVDGLYERLHRALQAGMEKRRDRLEGRFRRLAHTGPLGRLRELRSVLAARKTALIGAARIRIEDGRRRFLAASAALEALDPLAVLGRGYALATKEPEGWIVTRAAALQRGDTVRVRVARGSFRAAVTGIESEVRKDGER
ncbi:MAG TPA: exodeoxyribonuclease VII large subunit [Syntrophales bacterium]|nr:exodeoxyribonuclease VII large subunit [Syntrophales bacterium]HOM07320.1 exodeoxyribonuclease VII large subunit [Syntrophales bacterium]HOO00713.1 exodeoxyribonuclease VII large subunit [Syntrophales bacterium]HPC01299.1 exodeoxyribonuclease VII large subunit [Syntrophales bacterium]HPQ06835.1 exodeoxyribonuclease VII large subunit [Syntrophales bacterium]